MSVRRLAEASVQPEVFAFSAENEAWVERVLARYPADRQQSAVIPMLMRAQEQDGWVTKAAIEHVADRLRMPMIRVLEVATFYTQFQLKPVGTRAHIQVCGTTPCMLRGSDDLKKICRQRISPEPFQTNESGTLSWEEVECLGACVNAPMVMIFKDTFEDLTGDRLLEIIDAFDEGRGSEVRRGPQIDRHLSVPQGGLTTLTSFRDDDDIADAHDEAAAGASGSAREETATTPSQAGRPETSAPETDPSLQSPGKASAAESDEAAERRASVDPSEGAERPGAGRTGGTRQGETGQVERDKAEFGSARGSTDGEARTDGPLRTAGAAAEDAVVEDHKRVPGDERSAASDAEDLSNRNAAASGRLEQDRRDTSDVQPAGDGDVPSGSENRSVPGRDRDAKN